MNKSMLIVIFFIIGFSLAACGMITINVSSGETMPIVTTNQTTESLDICSLVSKAEIEAILAEPANDPKYINGSCVFTNAKDSLHMVSIAAGQGDLAKGILEGQAMMTGLAGAQINESGMAKIKSLAESMDFKGFFSELVSATGRVPSFKARLINDQKNDVVYWAWITAQSRRQGDLVIVRGPSIVNINLIVADTKSEDSMLAASMELANKILDNLPLKFSVLNPSETPDLSGANKNTSQVNTPTYIGGSILNGTPTFVSGPTTIINPTIVGTPTWVGVPVQNGTPTPIGGGTLISSPTPVK